MSTQNVIIVVEVNLMSNVKKRSYVYVLESLNMHFFLFLVQNYYFKLLKLVSLKEIMHFFEENTCLSYKRKERG